VSEEDVDVVRTAVETFGRNDRDESWALWAEDATAEPPPEWPEAGTNNGLQEIRAAFDGFDDAFGPDWPLDLKVVGIEDAGGGRVLVTQEWDTSGASSGVTVNGEIAGVYTVTDGLISHGAYFTSHDEGRKAAGLG